MISGGSEIMMVKLSEQLFCVVSMLVQILMDSTREPKDVIVMFLLIYADMDFSITRVAI